MKGLKFISIFTLVCVFVISMVCFLNATSNKSKDEEEQKALIAEKRGVDPEYIYYYQADTAPKYYKHQQLTEDELKSDTATLIDLCFNSDYWFFYAAAMSFIPEPSVQQYEYQKQMFNGFAELAKREDAARCLRAKYEELFGGSDTVSDVRSMMESMLMSDDFKR